MPKSKQSVKSAGAKTGAQSNKKVAANTTATTTQSRAKGGATPSKPSPIKKSGGKKKR